MLSLPRSCALILALGTALAGPADGEGAILRLEGDSSAVTAADPGVIRRAPVTVDVAGVERLAPGDTVRVPRRGGPDLVGVVDRVRGTTSGRLILHASMPGTAGATMILVRDERGVTGIVRDADGMLLRIDPAPGGGHVLSDLDPGRYPACGGAPEVEPMETAGPAADGGPCDDGTVVDVLVLYTPVAAFAAGGTAAIETEIEMAVELANESYFNSAILLELNVVHMAETDYDEDGTYNQHLSRLRSGSDGIMDEAHSLRDEYGADLVSLLVNDGEFCGLAYRMADLSAGFASSAFSVVTWYCAVSNITFAHELGHNQGCCHDHDNGCANPLYDYSFGHRFTGTNGVEYRTIMAYAPGLRIDHFSTPGILYAGVPTGVPIGQPDAADNARTIGNSALTVANFRCSVPPPMACLGDLDGSGDVGFGDVLQIIGAWGPCGVPCPEDLDQSGDVGFGDVLTAIGAWGPCG